MALEKRWNNINLTKLLSDFGGTKCCDFDGLIYVDPKA
jgi:hypothetical protein